MQMSAIFTASSPPVVITAAAVASTAASSAISFSFHLPIWISAATGSPAPCMPAQRAPAQCRAHQPNRAGKHRIARKQARRARKVDQMIAML